MNERIPLSFLLTQNADEDPAVEPTVPFAAMFGDSVKIVTAVLDRTAVLSEPSDRYARISVKHDQVLVDPATIEWRTKTSEYDGTRLLTNIKPGATGAALMGRHRRPARRQSMTITPGNVPGPEARQASDERALQNQRDVKAQKERELAAHRQRTTKRIEEEAMSTATIEESPPAIKVIASPGEKHAKCFTCKTTKPASAFPPIHRGPNVCLECGEKKTSAANPSTATRISVPVATPATNGPANGSDSVAAKKLRKPRLKKGRASGKPRAGKKIKLGETALLVAKGPHDNVVRLLEKRDSLRTQLADVQAQLLEAIG